MGGKDSIIRKVLKLVIPYKVFKKRWQLNVY